MLLAAGDPADGLFRVVEVTGRRPTLLTDFIGADALVILVDGEPRWLTGMGGMTAGGMEFEQREPADGGQSEVQVWAVVEDGDGTFWVERSNVGRSMPSEDRW